MTKQLLQLYKLSFNFLLELHKVNYETWSGREWNFQHQTMLILKWNFHECYPSDRAKQNHPTESKKYNHRCRRKTLHILETTLNMNIVCFFGIRWSIFFLRFPMEPHAWLWNYHQNNKKKINEISFFHLFAMFHPRNFQK